VRAIAYGAIYRNNTIYHNSYNSKFNSCSAAFLNNNMLHNLHQYQKNKIMQTKILYAVLLSLTAVTTVLATALHAGKNGKQCCNQWNHYQQPEKGQDSAGNITGKDSTVDYPFIPLFIQ
jgi:hypothetical protein